MIQSSGPDMNCLDSDKPQIYTPVDIAGSSGKVSGASSADPSDFAMIVFILFIYETILFIKFKS